MRKQGTRISNPSCWTLRAEPPLQRLQTSAFLSMHDRLQFWRNSCSLNQAASLGAGEFRTISIYAKGNALAPIQGCLQASSRSRGIEIPLSRHEIMCLASGCKNGMVANEIAVLLFCPEQANLSHKTYEDTNGLGIHYLQCLLLVAASSSGYRTSWRSAW